MTTEIISLLNNWKSQSEIMQSLIDDMVENKNYRIATQYQDRLKILNDCIRQLDNVLLSSGSELGVLDAPEQSHGALLAVGESHASGADTTENSEHTNAGALKKITSEEKICVDTADFDSDDERSKYLCDCKIGKCKQI